MTDPPAPTAVVHDGHTTQIKWHRARRRADDPAFTTSRIVEGMTLGASVEVDLVIHADRGFAVLHDRDVAHATTGTGRISELPASYVRTLFLRSDTGVPLDEPVLLLEDLSDVIARPTVHPDALLQLDFKEDAKALDTAAIDTFARAVAPIARNAILSCGDAEAVRLLTDPVPGIRVGYDPCHHGAVDRVLRSGDFAAFVERAVTASPRAELIYLERRLILEADRRGFDVIAAFHAYARTVDAYTLQRADDESVRQARRLVELRVDQITTDDPEGLIAALTG
ncbi:glycerophosphodiester phosphodiesterase [Gordonia hankookensis]|uniref:Glycerophosphodiester phosphodiesterase n=1 Tax=Gordonia hankookensis TaxID=589403 RepID=A0ABR7WA74_9ACTN|nr:glycerophosphodiester phosphodiesterase family protein [Gordonia hankookensis]MBD1319500.1 glycerophosphodiester phosphodiesterase [Gordonia hankookensis]